MSFERLNRVAGRALRHGYWYLFTPLRAYLIRRIRSSSRIGSEKAVSFLLLHAWGMGGTTRATHNLAECLAQRHEVEIISFFRRVETPFFRFPGGIKVTALDDQRPGRRRRASHTVLSRLPSLLVHPGDGAAHRCNAWMDAMLARHLSGRSGFLIGTRPGFNLLAAKVRRPTFRAIGQEHIHLGVHSRLVRREIRRHYPKLDVLAVLTARDALEYGDGLGATVDVREIPNSAKVTGPEADLASQVVLAAGRLRREKGFDRLITAFSLVHPGRPSWRLRICGSGHLRKELRAQALAEGLEGVVDLPGPRDLSDEMARASIFVLSSRFEGFPIVLIEAMRKGMAVVSFDCPTGPRELIEDHQNGILVHAGDTAALAAAITEFIDDDDLRRRCAAAAKVTGEDYSPEEIGARWETLLAEISGRSRGGRLSP